VKLQVGNGEQQIGGHRGAHHAAVHRDRGTAVTSPNARFIAP
jgi:hypothetical protein